MTTLRDVLLPGVPRNIFGYFLEHPSVQPVVQGRVGWNNVPIEAVTGLAGRATPVYVNRPDARVPQETAGLQAARLRGRHPVAEDLAYSDGLVEPGDASPLYDDFAAPCMGEFEPVSHSPYPSHDSLGEQWEYDGESVANGPDPGVTGSSEVESAVDAHLVGDGQADAAPTLASWLAGVRDHLRTRPWFRILCELKLMTEERRARRAARTSESPAADQVAEDVQAITGFTQAIHGLTQAMNRLGDQQAFGRSSWDSYTPFGSMGDYAPSHPYPQRPRVIVVPNPQPEPQPQPPMGFASAAPAPVPAPPKPEATAPAVLEPKAAETAPVVPVAAPEAVAPLVDLPGELGTGDLLREDEILGDPTPGPAAT